MSEVDSRAPRNLRKKSTDGPVTVTMSEVDSRVPRNLIKVYRRTSYCDYVKMAAGNLPTGSHNRMAWQWAETLVEIRETLADIRGTTK